MIFAKYIRAGLMLAALAGCASPDPLYYTLQPVSGAVLQGAPARVEVRRPGLAGYLDRATIVLRAQNYRLDVKGETLWGEPLGDMLGRVLAQDLAQRLPASTVFAEGGAITADPDVRVEIDIQRFDADASGAVTLAGELAIEPGRAHIPTAAEPFSLTATPSDDSPAALVATMSALLGRLADQTAGTLHPV